MTEDWRRFAEDGGLDYFISCRSTFRVVHPRYVVGAGLTRLMMDFGNVPVMTSDRLLLSAEIGQVFFELLDFAIFFGYEHLVTMPRRKKRNIADCCICEACFLFCGCNQCGNKGRKDDKCGTVRNHVSTECGTRGKRFIFQLMFCKLCHAPAQVGPCTLAFFHLSCSFPLLI
jgi:hypothetical protein